tara:strand:- start:301 stop:786 length:486 start_codon:yes stop_codon:yes gene_type:complete
MGKKGLRGLRKSSNPRYFEDYDKNDDDALNVIDAQLWAQAGRNDVAQRLARMIGSGNLPRKRASLTRAQKSRSRRIYGVPKTRWMKMNPRQRRAQARNFSRGMKARAQAVRRTRRMFRGARKLQGDGLSNVERGRLSRTSRRMHGILERRRRRFRVRKMGK